MTIEIIPEAEIIKKIQIKEAFKHKPTKRDMLSSIDEKYKHARESDSLNNKGKQLPSLNLSKNNKKFDKFQLLTKRRTRLLKNKTNNKNNSSGPLQASQIFLKNEL